MVTIALAGTALVAGLASWAALRRWPLLDPGAPAGIVRTVGEEVRRDTPTFIRRRLDPATTTGLGLTVGVGITVAGGGLLAILAFLVRSNPELARIDRGAATWGSTNASDASTAILRGVTQLGGTTAIVLLAVAVMVFAVVRARAHRLHGRAIVEFLVVVVVGQNLVANLVKLLVDRARPDIDPLAGFSGASFPSGHTTAAFAAFCAFALVLGRGRGPRVQAAMLGAALGTASAVGMTRVFLGVHWFTDVIAGAALGLAWFSLTAIAFGGRLLQFGLPVAAGQRAATLTELNDDASPAVGPATRSDVPGR